MFFNAYNEHLKVRTFIRCKKCNYFIKLTVFFKLYSMVYLHYNDKGTRIYRIAIEKLLKRKPSKFRKPLIIKGTHQVGNTLPDERV